MEIALLRGNQYYRKLLNLIYEITPEILVIADEMLATLAESGGE